MVKSEDRPDGMYEVHLQFDVVKLMTDLTVCNVVYLQFPVVMEMTNRRLCCVGTSAVICG